MIKQGRKKDFMNQRGKENVCHMTFNEGIFFTHMQKIAKAVLGSNDFHTASGETASSQPPAAGLLIAFKL
jgi:hypothetical protein